MDTMANAVLNPGAPAVALCLEPSVLKTGTGPDHDTDEAATKENKNTQQTMKQQHGTVFYKSYTTRFL